MLRKIANPRWLEPVLRRIESGRFLFSTVGILGAVSAVLALPVIPVLASASLYSPRRWLPIAFALSLGCACGALILMFAFHALGLPAVHHYFPEVVDYQAWKTVENWVLLYGWAGLLLLSVSPLPEMPGLLVIGLMKPVFAPAFAAILAGKMLKYGPMAWLFSKFPQRSLLKRER